MKATVILCLLVAAASALTQEEKLFIEFVKQYNKTYDGAAMVTRFSIFKENLAFITVRRHFRGVCSFRMLEQAENSKNLSYSLGVYVAHLSRGFA